MSTTLGRTHRGGAGEQAPTRRQLDELDALLQRMLALPVTPGGEGEEPASSRASRSGPRLAMPPFPAQEMVPSVRGQPPSVEFPGGIEPPVPGGRHDLVEDVPADPVQELARRRLEQEDGGCVPFEPTWQPSAQTWGPLADSWRQTQPGIGQEDGPIPYMPAMMPPMSSAGPTVSTETVVVQEYPAIAASDPEPKPVTPPSPPAPPTRLRTPLLLWPLVAFNALFNLFLLPLGPFGSWLKGPAGGMVLGAVGILALATAVLLLAAEGFGWSW